MIYGERIKQLREMHHLTQTALAEKIPELRQDLVSRFEKERAVPDDEVVALIAASTGVTVGFLSKPPSVDLAAHAPQLRARSKLAEGSRNAAIQWARLVYETHGTLSRSVGTVPLQFTPMHGASPKEAAREVRRLLSLGSTGPLPYLVLAVERIGITVLGLPISEPNLDAFCAWTEGSPVIGLLDGVPGGRLRFNVAHELGHLALHPPGRTGKVFEVEADEFATELLAPLDGIRGEFPRRLTLSSLTMLKTQWGVSIRSLIRRARELDIIDSDRTTGLYRQISARGWNKAEPGHVPLEKPRAFFKLCEVVYGSGPNIPKLAMDAAWSEEMAQSVLSRHARANELPFVGSRNGSTKSDGVIDMASWRVNRNSALRQARLWSSDS